jgi:tRNA modification GTPase
LAEVRQQLFGRGSSDQFCQVVLVGPPNVGKSSLFNSLARRFRPAGYDVGRTRSQAIVSPLRGTTRDYLTAKVEIAGVACEVVDTAGIDFQESDASKSAIRNATVDAAAAKMAGERRRQANVRVFCVDATAPADGLEFVAAVSERDRERDIVVFTKADVILPAERLLSEHSAMAVSSVTGQGLGEFSERVGQLLLADSENMTVATTAERCRESVRLAGEAIERAQAIVRAGDGDELAAAEIRTAIDELGRVVGAVYTDDLLDRIFSTFCIGK